MSKQLKIIFTLNLNIEKVKEKCNKDSINLNNKKSICNDG